MFTAASLLIRFASGFIDKPNNNLSDGRIYNSVFEHVNPFCGSMFHRDVVIYVKWNRKHCNIYDADEKERLSSSEYITYGTFYMDNTMKNDKSFP